MCYNMYFKPVTYNGFTWVKDAYDGLVSRNSATGAGTSWTTNADIRELSGNNHQEMRTSTQSQIELNAAFEGLRSDGTSFRIAKR